MNARGIGSDSGSPPSSPVVQSRKYACWGALARAEAKTTRRPSGVQPRTRSTRMIGQSPGVAARSRRDVHVGVPRDSGREGDLRAVGREVRINLDAGRGGEPARLPAASRNDPQITRVFEGHRIAAHCRMTEQSRPLRGRGAEYRDTAAGQKTVVVCS